LKDDALNTSSGTSTTAYTYDTTAPSLIVTATDPAKDTGNDPTPTWSVNVVGAATVTCVLTEAGKTVDSASCPTSYTSGFTMVDNVQYTLTVTATDAATNATVVTKTYLFDNMKPVVTVSDPTPTSPNHITTVSWTSSDKETGLSTECSLYKDAVAGTPLDGPVACSRTKSYSLTSAGTYYMVAVDVDAAGNRSDPAVGGAYVLDLTPPDNPTVTGPTGPSSNPKPGWTITGTGDATTITCRVVLVQAVGPIPSPPDYGSCPDFSTYALPYDGVWRLDVITYDAAGNHSDTISSPLYQLDTTAPLAPAVSGPTGHGTQTSGSYSYTGEAGTTALCQLVRKGDAAPDFSPCPSPLQFGYPSDGFYTLNVRLVDAAQNLGAIGSSGEYERDTTAPVLSTIAGPVGPSQSRSPAWTFTSETTNGVVTTCRLTRGSIEITSGPCTSGFTADLTGQVDGQYVLTVVSTDLAGNVTTASSAPYELDTTKPVTPTVTGPAGPSQTRNPVFSWTSEVGTTSECSLKEKAGSAGAWTSCATPYAPSLPTDGSWVLSVRLTDAAKNVSDPGSSGAYVFDTTPPATPVVTPPASPGRDLSPSWSAATEEGSKVECRLTGAGQLGAWGACVLPIDTPISTEGSYTLEVRATD
ncbi:MAG: hypothetical protein LC708_02495, partial [Actinobacteria bacterium]|nr:hypothetical protein [Actinomycetota bacterium]